MNCPRCAAPNRDTALFCSTCGNPLVMSQGTAQPPAAPPPPPTATSLPAQPAAPLPAEIPFQQRMAEFSAANAAERIHKQSSEALAQRKATAEAHIDAFLRQVGIPDPESVTDERGWRHLRLGSAQGRAGIVEDEDHLYLHVEAYLMPLPSDGDLIVPLMRELLEINTVLRSSERLGIANEVVLIVNIRPVSILDDEDFARAIHGVMSLADHLDDKLLESYGGTSRRRVPPGTLAPGEQA